MTAKSHRKPVLTTGLLSGALMLTLALGTATVHAETDASALQQADYIETNRAFKHMTEVNQRVALTACNVMFAQTSAAHASTGGGIFSTVGNTRRAEASVSAYYTLSGVDDAELQAMTEEICASVLSGLEAKGFEVISLDELRQQATFQALGAAGRPSPFLRKGSTSRDTESTYKVFAPAGYSIFDERYIGTSSGLGQAFKAAAGDAAWQMETRVLDELGADGLNVNIVIDFANLQSSGQAGGYMLASRNSATVSGEVALGITGEVTFKPNSRLNCWDRFGKRECELRPQFTPVISSRAPVLASEGFYESVENTTTTGDKASAAITKGLAVAGALAGGGGRSRNITRYTVHVEPQSFKAVSQKNIDGFLDLALATAQQGKQ